jgi:hypothetical protein
MESFTHENVIHRVYEYAFMHTHTHTGHGQPTGFSTGNMLPWKVNKQQRNGSSFPWSSWSNWDLHSRVCSDGNGRLQAILTMKHSSNKLDLGCLQESTSSKERQNKGAKEGKSMMLNIHDFFNISLSMRVRLGGLLIQWEWENQDLSQQLSYMSIHPLALLV